MLWSGSIQKYFDFEKVKLKFTDGALRAIAKEALRRNTGARGLRSIMEEIMLRHDARNYPRAMTCKNVW